MTDTLLEPTPTYASESTELWHIACCLEFKGLEENEYAVLTALCGVTDFGQYTNVSSKPRCKSCQLMIAATEIHHCPLSGAP